MPDQLRPADGQFAADPGSAAPGHAPKIETAGLLSAGIAHDFNNLLTVINGYNELLLSSCELPDKARQWLNVVRGAGERAASLARGMMALSRRTPQEPRMVDINECVKELLSLAQHLVPSSVELSAVMAPGLDAVLTDRCGILQVLLNLVVNSRDAMPGGGKLEIQTANLDPDAASSGSHPYLPRGRYILLTVTDDGTGMDSATRQRIFEPFYTTKAQGAGNGLGLPMVHHIVKQSGGFLSIESAKGKGTSVRIYLPAAAAQGEKTVETTESVESKSPLSRGAETILVVEDNVDLCNLMRDLLAGLGYTVLAAGSASEAAELSNGLDGRLDLVVADSILPDSSAKELAECLQESRPGLPVLNLSDAFDGDDPAGSVPGADHLAKPFTMAAFGERVRTILDRKKRKRVLFVDDDPQVVMFAAEVLREAGYDVLVGEDGNVALAMVEVESVDLIVTDLVMRECEGLETMMRLKKSHPEIPVVAISGAFGGHFLRSAAMLGARATLAKPFSGEDLLGVVGRVLAS